MKRNIGIVKIVFGLFVMFTLNKVNGQNSKDTTAKYLNKLIASDKPEDKVTLNSALKKLAASDKETDIILAANLYYNMKDARVSDSLQQVELIKFPNGIAARNKDEQIIFYEMDAKNAEKLYERWIAKYPPSNFSGDDHGYIVYDYASSYIADLFAKEKNVIKTKQYISYLKEDFWKGNAYSGLSAAFYKNGDLADAEIYAKKAMNSAAQYLNATDGAGRFAASGYPGLCNTYVNILYEEKKYDEALKYIQALYKHNKELNIATNYTYAKLLMHFNRNQEAYDKLDTVMKTGRAAPELVKTFKQLYVTVKGSDKGYANYMADIRVAVLKNLKEKLAKEIMDKPAPLFTLTDIYGKKVSLKDYRGKTVVLDFWATWCGPCKRSFPAMQMIQNKYKNDPNVKFLFIHTWEKSDNATAEAKAYIQKMKYNFEVLMDLKDPKTKENKVVSSYGVKGIPAKFIIDPNGNIRFQLTGFEGSNEAAVDEVSTMIDLARNPN